MTGLMEHLTTRLDARVLSIQIGRPQTMRDESRIDSLPPEWTSAIFKEPVSGPVHLSHTGIDGDGQADLSVHGGSHQAVLFYAAAHYPGWREELDKPDLDYGAFGENLTISDLSEETVCIGDRFALGEAIVEVSQPRRPCWKLSRRNGVGDLAQRVQRNGRGGWYTRVLREGYVEAGQRLVLVERPYPEWTVQRTNNVMYRRENDPAVRTALASCPALSPRWRRVISGTGPDTT